MNCPEHLALKIGRLYVWMWYYDVPRERIPLRVWWNPLRYEIGLAGTRFWINREGKWRHIIPNAIFRVKKKLGLLA